MILLIGFAFLAGIVTILSPCILPILPIILSSSVDSSGKGRPLGVITGFVLSFTFFTLFLTSIVKLIGVPANSLRFFSIIVLVGFGLSLLVPQFQALLEKLFSKLSRFSPKKQREGFGGGIIIGLSLGLLWTPCVGPILASVISLALTGTVNAQAAIITLAYASGTVIPMFLIIQAGSTALQKVPWLLKNSAKIQKAFGVLMILTAVGIYFNVDRQFQSYILEKFPGYGAGLTKIEDNQAVRDQLEKVSEEPMDASQLGKPMSDLVSPEGPLAPELIPGGQWFNSEPLKLSDLRRKVVIIDFWTYSCINCQRTFPYLRDWWSKYKDQGLVIIGVHSPEFEFEKDPDNLAKAIEDFGLDYPIVQDNDFATWRAYNNRYWPAKYFIDKDGLIRYTHFGEGAYGESEKVIQELLAETGTDVSSTQVNTQDYEVYSKTPETYLGYKRLSYFASPESVGRDVVKQYSAPARILNNQFALEGNWNIMAEYAAPQGDTKLYLNFEAKQVFLVARPKNGGSTIDVYVDDVKTGEVEVNEDKLYELVNLETPGRHDLRLEFTDPNIELYAFTFG